MKASPPNGQRLLVALSGGVDSAVAAALAQQQGFRVEAAYMKNWINEEDILGDCPWQQDIADAAAVADHLGIPFRVLNFMTEYRRKIVQYLLDGYTRGLTPNPDVLCNREMKFGVLLQWALQNGFDAVATGHYCHTRPQPGALPQLHEGRDPEKDQSYFLCLLQPRQLLHAVFPIGLLTKPEVRRTARQLGLPNADKKDSQGICFIGQVKINDFLAAYIPDQPGPIVDLKGQHLGTHRGLHRYTIGQRRGIGVPSNADNEFYVVVAKRMQSNELVIAFESSRPDPLWHDSAQLHSLSFLVPEPPSQPTDLEVKVRYRDPRVPARWIPGHDLTTGQLQFQSPQRALASGQICALYHKTQLLGGGVYV